MGSLESILAGQMKDRVVYRFTVPESIKGDIRSIGMVEMTADEEIGVEARCKGASERRAAEIAKASIWELNGQRVHNADGTIDKAWNTMSPKLRTLVNREWVRIHIADDAESESFSKSMTVNV